MGFNWAFKWLILSYVVLHNPPTQYPMSQAIGSTHASRSVDSDFKYRLSNRA